MTLGITDDTNYTNIANAIRDMSAGDTDGLTLTPSEMSDAIRGLRSVWGNIEGSIANQTDLQNALNSKQSKLTFDSTPTANSNNPVKSSGIKTALNNLQNQIDNINKFAIHICSASEYDSETYIPTVSNPQSNTFYLVPTGTGNDVYAEWIYTNNHWEKFGVNSIDLNDLLNTKENVILKTASGTIASFDDGIEAPAAHVVTKIEPVQEGSGDPSPDNVRPISGWDGVTVTRTGKNLLPSIPNNVTLKGITYSLNKDGSVTCNGTATASYACATLPVLLKGGETYILSGCPSGGSYDTYRLDIRPAENEEILFPGYEIFDYGTGVLIAPQTDICIRIGLRFYTGYVASNITFYPMIRLASDLDDTYEPYQGDTYDISFGEAGTVYGGELDVTTGVLTVTHKVIDLSTIGAWESISGNRIRTNAVQSEIKGPSNLSKGLMFAENYQYVSNKNLADDETLIGISVTTNGYISLRLVSGTPEGKFVYELATPITYQLTPQQLTTLLGQNNIWADTGDIAVDYWKNDKLAAVISTTVNTLKNDLGLKRYGVSGYGQSATELTRTFDAVGMVAQVGTDGDNTSVRNDFDTAAPFMRRKCVGEWTLEDGHAVFHVRAYYGDDNYTEDGTMGDYVAVECPRAYYYHNGSHLVISAHQYPGYRPFDIFCRNHNPADTMPFVYLPAYALALKDGQAVSLPDLDNEQGAWWTMMSDARTYDNGALGNKAGILPASVNFYEYALMTVEFAVQDMQSVMHGCTDLASADNTEGTFKTLTEFITPYKAGYVAGQYVAITNNKTHYTGTYQATHHVTAVTRCDASGNASSSGSYVKLTVTDLGKTYDGIVYNTTDSFYIGSRPYRTGACNAVSTPSGSPVSNTDGYHPMKYRWRENVYGNQWWNSSDLFAERVGTGDSDWTLKWYILNDPEDYTVDDTSRPNAEDLASALFTELDVVTAHDHYKNGYIKTKEFSVMYPDLWIPGETTGASATTYFCDNAYLVFSNVVRAVRFGGAWYNGTNAGPSAVYANHAVSNARAHFGAHLYIKQG